MYPLSQDDINGTDYIPAIFQLIGPSAFMADGYILAHGQSGGGKVSPRPRP
jgi:hypothetical protein